MERSNLYINQYQQYMKIGKPESLDPGRKRWTLDFGLWTLGSRRWTLDAGLWTLVAERWAVGAER